MQTRSTSAIAMALALGALAGGLLFGGLPACVADQGADPLPSWNDGPAKTSILDFVAKTTKAGGAHFVPVAERIAVFDNDGTLWPENPVPFELAFAFDRVKADAARHPEWKEKQPFKAVLENDLRGLATQGMQGLIELVYATHAGMTTDEFDRNVRN